VPLRAFAFRCTVLRATRLLEPLLLHPRAPRVTWVCDVYARVRTSLKRF